MGADDSRTLRRSLDHRLPVYPGWTDRGHVYLWRCRLPMASFPSDDHVFGGDLGFLRVRLRPHWRHDICKQAVARPRHGRRTGLRDQSYRGGHPSNDPMAAPLSRLNEIRVVLVPQDRIPQKPDETGGGCQKRIAWKYRVTAGVSQVGADSAALKQISQNLKRRPKIRNDYDSRSTKNLAPVRTRDRLVTVHSRLRC